MIKILGNAHKKVVVKLLKAKDFKWYAGFLNILQKSKIGTIKPNYVFAANDWIERVTKDNHQSKGKIQKFIKEVLILLIGWHI